MHFKVGRKKRISLDVNIEVSSIGDRVKQNIFLHSRRVCVSIYTDRIESLSMPVCNFFPFFLVNLFSLPCTELQMQFLFSNPSVDFLFSFHCFFAFSTYSFRFEGRLILLPLFIQIVSLVCSAASLKIL